MIKALKVVFVVSLTVAGVSLAYQAIDVKPSSAKEGVLSLNETTPINNNDVVKKNEKTTVDVSSGSTEPISQTPKQETQTNTNKATTLQKEVTLEEAKQLALKEVNGKIIRTKTDNDEYEIKIESGDYIFEIDVERNTGRIDDIEKEKKPLPKLISEEQAKQIALNKVGGVVDHIEYDGDDNEYEVEVNNNEIEYEVTINANNGKIVKVEKDDG